MVNLRKKRKPQAVKEERPASVQARRIDAHVPPAIYEKVEALVKDGLYLSMSDFGRAAVREKLIAMGLAKRA